MSANNLVFIAVANVVREAMGEMKNQVGEMANEMVKMTKNQNSIMELMKKQQAEKKEEEDNNPRPRKKPRTKKNGSFATAAMRKHINKNAMAKKIEVF